MRKSDLSELTSKTFQGAHIADLKIGIVTAEFNSKITNELKLGANNELRRWGYLDSQIFNVTVPGAYEIPLAAKWMFQAGIDGVIALGAVIRGETAHFDYVCRSVERGCSLLQIESGRPVVFGVLTTDTLEQAVNRIGGSHGHKGIEAAQVLLDMVNLKQKILTTSNLKGAESWPNPPI